MDNLIELVGQQITPDVLSQLAGVAGESQGATQSAVNAAVPSLLGSMLSSGSTPAGAGQLLEMLTSQPSSDDLVGNLAGMLGGQDSNQAMMQMGSSMLSGLMGDQSSGIFDLISNVAGIKKGSASSIMALLAPVVMGMVKKQLTGQSGGGLNLGSLTSLLAGQKDFIAAAAPPGLTDALGIGSFDDVKFDMPDLNLEAPKVTAPKVTAPKVAAPKVTAPKVDAPAPAVSGGGMGRWLWPLLAVLVLGGLLWWFLAGRQAPQVPEVTVPAVTMPDIALPDAVCTNVASLEESLGAMPAITADTQVSAVKDSLAGVSGAITQISSAVATVEGLNIPGLDTIESTLGTVQGLVDGLTGDTLGDTAGEIDTLVGQVKDAGAEMVAGVNCN
ncbi:MAG: DUF937 domain-containing protein [Caldilineaceae bacterium]|nr:DUF937 domain-containing protein [Caldilineaceae bacterium]